MTMILRRLDNAGAFPPFSSGMNFWIVVKTTRRRDIEQLAYMVDRICLHRSLSQNFVATLELAEELIVQVVPIRQENQRLFDDGY
jgi:2'-5' RNA ligase